MRPIPAILFAFVSVLIALPLSAATIGSGIGDNSDKPETRPNVIVVMTDDQGIGDLGFHGNEQIRTPHLDQFARESIRFNRFYVCPVCAPTRASLLTGRDFYRTGVIHTSRGAAKMHGDEFTIAESLRNAGYRTGIFGKWHLGDNYPMRPQDQGFEEVLVHRSGGITQTPDIPNSYFDSLLWKNGEKYRAKGYCTDVFFDAAMQYIETPREEPFFVYIPTNAPHTPLEIDEQYVEPYRKMGLNEATAKVYGMVENIDDNMGRLLKFLDEKQLRENTLVIFLTDNGAQQERYNAGFRGRKSTTYEGGIRVPCFWQWPARWKGDREIDTITAHIDLFPTLREICGAKEELPHQLDGVSLLPLLDETATDWPARSLHFQVHRGLQPQVFQNSALVTERWKLVGYPGTFGKDDFATDPENPLLELYDLQNDPAEKQNLAAEQPAVLAKLKQDYLDWFESVKAERKFLPGVIVLGDRAAPKVHLCRYQDGSFEGNQSMGWLVEVKEPGEFRVRVKLGEQQQTPTRFKLEWNETTRLVDLTANVDTFETTLSAGRGLLQVTSVDPQTGEAIGWGTEKTAGDVILELLDR